MSALTKALLRSTTFATVCCLFVLSAIGQSSVEQQDGQDRQALIRSLQLHAPNLAVSTEREIETIAKKIAIGNAQFPEIWICANCGGSYSDPKIGLVVDLGQIDRIVSASGSVNRHIITEFIFDHEMAHHVQRSLYGALENRPLEDRRYYEAQADILAGLWLYQNSNYMTPEVLADNHTIADALHAVYDLGVEQYALANHPSREARAFATRTGFQIALSRRPFQGDSFSNQINKQIFERQFGLQAGDTDLSVTLRMAKRLTGFNSSAAIDLVRLNGRNDIVWDTSSDNPTVKYNLTYAARGTKALHVSMEVMCLAAFRQDNKDFFRSFQVSAKFHEFDIPAGGKTTISGELRWMATAERSPQLRFAPDDFGLVEVHYQDGSDSSTPASTGESMRVQRISPVEKIPTESGPYELLFQQLLQRSLNGYRDIRKGVGEELLAGRPHWDSTLAVPGSIASKVTMGRTANVTSTLTRTSDAAHAISLYKATVGLVRSALGNTSVPGSTDLWQGSSSDDDPYNKSADFELSPFRVSVSIESDEEGGGLGVKPVVYYYVKVRWSGQRQS